uniref:Uncharacterized protein n=1 Tax=Eutreptiella gymnastica TaxID=73025 RepID=A0A7S1HS38_9EUGL
MAMYRSDMSPIETPSPPLVYKSSDYDYEAGEMENSISPVYSAEANTPPFGEYASYNVEEVNSPLQRFSKSYDIEDGDASEVLLTEPSRDQAPSASHNRVLSSGSGYSGADGADVLSADVLSPDDNEEDREEELVQLGLAKPGVFKRIRRKDPYSMLLKEWQRETQSIKKREIQVRKEIMQGEWNLRPGTKMQRLKARLPSFSKKGPKEAKEDVDKENLSKIESLRTKLPTAIGGRKTHRRGDSDLSGLEDLEVFAPSKSPDAKDKELSEVPSKTSKLSFWKRKGKKGGEQDVEVTEQE